MPGINRSDILYGKHNPPCLWNVCWFLWLALPGCKADGCEMVKPMISHFSFSYLLLCLKTLFPDFKYWTPRWYYPDQNKTPTNEGGEEKIHLQMCWVRDNLHTDSACAVPARGNTTTTGFKRSRHSKYCTGNKAVMIAIVINNDSDHNPCGVLCHYLKTNFIFHYPYESFWLPSTFEILAFLTSLFNSQS